ncbi:hypothetical protein [Mesomycoplasma hyopneumoniae]|uniref:hypothetical protein n=1 Tax=Mesomycoplasma hyopneumoniae TaxID=2099 RepID=UPI0010848CFD|nr:hypothetical protein [Mesomycoplasma hyopneumoniae]QBY87444.1 hypothetical protein E5E95_00685 [Mesomycoplasma hyopneumoniae]
MKAISLFFYSSVIRSGGLKVSAFILIIGMFSFNLFNIFASFSQNDLLWIRCIFYFFLTSPVLYIVTKYFRFIKKYKSEALVLSDQEFTEKYYKLVTKPLRYTRFNAIIRDLEEFNQTIEDETQKKQILFRAHYRIFILEALVILISLVLFLLWISLTEANLINLSVLPKEYDKNHSLRGALSSIIFSFLLLFLIIINVFTRNFLHYISSNLLRYSIKTIFDYYKKSPWRFFMK